MKKTDLTLLCERLNTTGIDCKIDSFGGNYYEDNFSVPGIRFSIWFDADDRAFEKIASAEKILRKFSSLYVSTNTHGCGITFDIMRNDDRVALENYNSRVQVSVEQFYKDRRAEKIA